MVSLGFPRGENENEENWVEADILEKIVSVNMLLLAPLEPAYSLIWGIQEIWGKGGGETLALL